MKTILFMLIVTLFLFSCSPSPEAIQEAIKETQAAKPTATPYPTNTPTNMPEPTATPTSTQEPTKTVEPEEEFNFIDIMKEAVLLNSDVEALNMIKGDNGILKIELRTQWASKDRQPIISYEIISLLAEIIIGSRRDEYDIAFWSGSVDGEQGKFLIEITTFSTNGEHRYYSLTDFSTLTQIHDKTISYDEWVNAAQAGFN